MRKLLNYFTKFELVLWISSVLFITASFILFDNGNYLTLVASLVGATALIFNAKGNPFGQFLFIIFGLLYGIISYSYAYYGEMITYMGMTVPMAFVALASWLRNPYKNRRSEVKISQITLKECIILIPVTIVVTLLFYYILKVFGTANILPSTISITTSFVAVYLTYRRSPYFAIAYALNDIVLIVLWLLATFNDTSYFSVIICFIMFLFNDLYTFANWKKMQKRQSKGE